MTVTLYMYQVAYSIKKTDFYSFLKNKIKTNIRQKNKHKIKERYNNSTLKIV